MPDWTGITNMALLGLKVRPVTDILTDTSTAAIAVRSVYLTLADEVLYAHPWKTALKRFKLGQSGTPPVDNEWQYAYDFPTIPYALRAWSIWDGDGWTDWRSGKWTVEGRQILTNLPPPLSTRFIVRVADPNQFAGLLATAMSRRIKWEVAYTLTNSREKEADARSEFKEALADARSADSQQGTPRDTESHEIESARF